MNSTQVNYLNMGLMALSCVLAFIMPFELFLFSYAVLGPLHYLTEISWLHKRHCFSPGKNDFILLAVLALLITIPNVLPYFYSLWGPKDMDGHPIVTEELSNFFMTAGRSVPAIIFIAFAGSAVLILTKSTVKRVLGFLVIAMVGYAFHTEKFLFITFSVLLPTLVHVYLFTGAFILVGALKGRSASGMLSLLIFLACTASLFLLFPDRITAPSAYAEKTYDATFFAYSRQLFDAFMHKIATRDMIYHSSVGIVLARFVAFAYTYHYLNWFSKTSIIKWHKVPRRALIAVFVLWGLSLVLYATNYMTGIMALYLLSFIHVIFEFPLNFQSFREIGNEVRKRLVVVKG